MQQENRYSGASTSLSAVSPSFTSYSSEYLADIAARVVHELNLSHDDPYDDAFYASSLNQTDTIETDNVENNDDLDDDSEFEFAVLCGGEEFSSPISADEIFYNGQIKPIYPLFNTDLVFGPQTDSTDNTATVRVPLRKLMKDERERGNDSVSSTSSSSDNELLGVPQGTYCVWVPKKKNAGETDELMKKKSNSTGASSSSKRWRFKDLLYRSNSDGKDTFVFLTPSLHHHHNHSEVFKKKEKIVTAVNTNGADKKKGVDNKKKSYLPYRQDLVGFFGNVNGVSRTIRPF